MNFHLGKDKREYKRVSQYFLLKYKKQGEGEKKTLTFIRNISGGGLLFFTKEKIDPGTIMKVEINIATSRGRSILFTATVVSVREESLSGNKGYNVGVKFENIDEKDRESLIEAIESRRL